MTLQGFSVALNLFALTPLLLTLGSAFIAWKHLARRWAFVLIGGIVSYVLAGIAWLWLMTGIGISGEDSPAGRVVRVVGAPNGLPISLKVSLAHVLVLAAGAAVFGLMARAFRKR